MAERQSEPVDVRVATLPDFETWRRRPHLDLRRATEAQLVGTADRALLAAHIERARAQRARALRSAQLEVADASAPPLRRDPHLVTDAGKMVRLKRVRRPEGPPMFSETEVHVAVRADGPLGGVLRIPIDPKRVSSFVPGSVRLARWDESAKRPFLLPASSYRADHGYAFGRVTRPGVYTVVGLPLDERILATLRTMQALSPWLDGDGAAGLVPKICQLILCAEPDGGLGPAPGDLCSKCLGGAGRDLDLDLFATIELVPGVIQTQFAPIPPRCLEWDSLGPNNVPGRISALVIHPIAPKVLYAGSAAGGVFASSDGGNTWRPLWHGQLSLAIGGLAISRSDPKILYAATGEWVGSGFTVANHFPGVGVYRTSDGGSDWDLLAPIPSNEASAVAIDPTDADRVYVAGNIALHRTRDGGKTWDVTAPSTKGIFDGVITDVVVDPADPMRVYVAVDLDGIWTSANGGNTWTKLTNGIGTGALAISPKIALGRGGTHGTKFVAVLMARKVFTSIDGGNTFTQRTDVDPVPWAVFQAPWATVIAVDPTNEQILLAGHVSLSRSVDGGATWTVVGGPSVPITNVHVDQQTVVFDPTDHDHVFVATDGGVSVSDDNGQTWKESSYGLVTTQCWTVAASQDAKPQRLLVTTQDNKCYRSAPGSFSFAEILPWEGGIVEVDPTNADVIYADTWFQLLKRSMDGGATWTLIEPNAALDGEALSISRQDPMLLLAVKTDYSFAPPRKRIHRSTNQGTTWVQTLGGASNQFFETVAFAPSDDSHAYVGETNGKVAHSADKGVTWWVLPTGTLPGVRIRRIAVDWKDPKRFYVAFGALGVRQLWRGDIGATANAVSWTDVSGRIAAPSLPDLAITGIALHPSLEETIYVSNILGVYRSIDGGESWAPYDEGLPNCFVSDLDIRPLAVGAMLYASTMGRGVYSRRV